MKSPREIFENAEREQQKMELKEILDKPVLTSEEIWEISEENFFIWRKKYDYPRIIKHFNEKLNGFNEWKNEYSLDDEFLINYGISNCIKPNFHKDKLKYVIEREWNGEVTKSISFQNIDKKHYRLGPHKVNHKVIKSFIGYLDWCKGKKIKILPERRDNKILSLHSKSGVGSPHIEINILEGLTLLKVGGIKVKPSGWGILKTKYFEFVNADYLSFEGKLATQGKKLSFDYSFVDNLNCQNLDLALVEFNDSSVSELEIKDSNIQQWNFTRCNTSGKIRNSDFRFCNIYGGNFYVEFKNTSLFDSSARHSLNKELSFEGTYRTFKQAYSQQGDDSKAVLYFLLEKRIERLKVRKGILNPQFPKGLFIDKWIKRNLKKIFYGIANLIRYLFLVINNLFWGYGRKPIRIIGNSLFIILGFAFIYFLSKDCIVSQKEINLVDSLYYSTTTFLTFGISDFNPIGDLKIAVLIEALFGGLSLGFLIAGFSNSKF